MATNAQIAQAANLLLPPLPLGGGLGTLQDAIESGGRSLSINNPNSPISTLISKIAAAGGITAASQFRITSNFTGDAEPMVNWEVGDTDGYGTLGSAMTESSGLFTFPSTGYWLITLFIKDQNDVDDPYASYDILSTTNNSSYGTAAGISLGYSGGHYGSASAEFLFDVTSTTNCKVRFDAANRNASNTVGSSSSYNATYATFIRLGDT